MLGSCLIELSRFAGFERPESAGWKSRGWNHQKRIMLMTDDTGWNDFGCYSLGGAGLGHPTP
jgi:hypothetical protein